MAAALYRVNFVFRGTARSMLKLLPDPPSIGQRLNFEHIALVVTDVDHDPTNTSVAATIQAAVDASLEEAR